MLGERVGLLFNLIDRPQIVSFEIFWQ